MWLLKIREDSRKKQLFTCSFTRCERFFFTFWSISPVSRSSMSLNMVSLNAQEIHSTRRFTCFWLEILSLWSVFNRWFHLPKMENLKWWPLMKKIRFWSVLPISRRSTSAILTFMNAPENKKIQMFLTQNFESLVSF